MQVVSRNPGAALRRTARLVPVTEPGEPPVVTTKLFLPEVGSRSVARPRLRGVLDRVVDVRLAVVVAPAGWGKSTALAQWLRDRPATARGWVSLDAGDSDLTRFWRYLLLAVERSGSPAAADALRRLDAPGVEVARDVLPLFVNDLAENGCDLVLVLDDYHVIANRAVHESLGVLLERGPRSLHLVIGTRVDPPLPLARLRVAGDLLEVRSDQLRLTATEAGLLLERASAAVPPEQVDRLVARTEGWAAGLQLAALRLADRSGAARADFVDRFTGADRHVVDYLGEEVLGGLSADERDFLLRTSVLRRLCAPLVDAVTGRSDGAELLDRIERANLFLIPLDDEGRWYRYHQLFRDILRHELVRSRSADLADLHRRAAAWHATQDHVEEAVDHAVQSGDPELLATMVAEQWRREFNLGHLQTVQSWLAALPAGAVAHDPRLTVAQVWLHLDGGRLDEADATLRRAEASAAEDGHVRALRTLYIYKTGDLGRAERLLRTVPSDLSDPFVVTVRELLAGMGALWSGRFDVARQVLQRAAERARTSGNRLALIYALGGAAVAAAEAGDPGGAGQLRDAARTEVVDGLVDAHFVATFQALADARLAAAEHRALTARPAADRAVALARRGAGRIELAAALVTAAQAARLGGGADAPGVLADARAVLRGCADPGPVVRDWLTREERLTQAAARPQPAVEELTERERDILGLLASPLSQRELAESLFVSPNTMKTHLRAIYRKLGAESRSDAVLRARSFGLL